MNSDGLPQRDVVGAQLATGRHRFILQALEQAEEVKITTLAAELGVSSETVRRDLRVLEGTGRLKRVHGGATALRGVDVRPYEERASSLVAEKQIIAECVTRLNLGGKGQRIFLGGGSTMMPIVQNIAQGAPVNVVTNAVDVATLLNRTGRHEVDLTGGRLNKNYELLTGSAAIESVRRLRFDLAITSTNAIDADLGFLEFFASEAELHRALSIHARTYVIVADHTKFGAVADHVAFGHGAVSIVVTDREPAAEFCARFEDADVQLYWPEASPEMEAI